MSIIEAMQLDAAQESARISERIRQVVAGDFKRRGAVIGLSGGIDSATVLALTARALGPEKVLTLLLPEHDSSPESAPLAEQAAAHYGVATLTENLTAGLAGLGCYARRDAAVREVYPDYDARQERIKLVLPAGLLERGGMNVFSLVRVRADGSEERRLLRPATYLAIVAASNMKQRSRMLMLYYHAEQRNYAVVGTANKNEHDQGFFVKWGDGGADMQPIQHLFKTQVYQLARYLGVPQEIIARPPTTDTYSATCTQEEFYFRLPFEVMDRIWYGLEHNLPSAQVAQELGLTEEQVQRVYSDLLQKARTTAYLRTPPVALEPQGGVGLG